METATPLAYEQLFVDHDGERLGLQVYPEPEPAGGPLVVLWPAMGVPARYYRPVATQLRDQGCAVVVADLRGTGASTPGPSRRSRYGYAELAGDIGAVLAAVRSRADGRTVILLGHSLGGQACALYLALSAASANTASATAPSAKGASASGAADGGADDRVDGLALVAVGLPWFRVYPGRRRRQVLVLTQWINVVSATLRVWPGWGFGGRQARGVIRDWAYTARHGRFPDLAGTGVEAALGRVETPVLAISLAGDRHTPAATMDTLCAKLSAAPVERVELGPDELGADVDHFSWARTATPIAARIAAFARGL